MAIADSNFGRLAIVAESTFGTTPATPTMQIVRMNSSDFSAQKETVTSNELRTDRMVSTVAEVSASSGGTVNFELSLGGTFDALLEAALCGTWTAAVDVTGAFTFAATANTITADAGTPFTNVSAGQWIFISDAEDVANNGWHKVTVKNSGSQITVATALADEAADTVTIKGKMLRNGTTKRSFSIEQALLDVNQFFLFRGQRLNSMSLSVQAGAVATGSFAFMGTSTERAATTFATSLTAATTTDVVNATSNVGTVLEDGVTLTTAIQSIQVQLDNALRNQNAVGSKFPVGIGYGRQSITGTIDAYFESGALFDKFLSHEASSLSFAFADAAGNAMRITLPKVFFQSDNPAPGGNDQDVMESLQFTAVLDPTTSCQIQIDMI